MTSVNLSLQQVFANHLQKEKVYDEKIADNLENICRGDDESSCLIWDGPTWVTTNIASFPAGVSPVLREICLDNFKLIVGPLSKVSSVRTNNIDCFTLLFGEESYGVAFPVAPVIYASRDKNYDNNGTIRLTLPIFARELGEIAIAKSANTQVYRAPFHSREVRDKVLWTNLARSVGVPLEKALTISSTGNNRVGDHYFLDFGLFKARVFSQNDDYVLIPGEDGNFSFLSFRKFVSENFKNVKLDVSPDVGDQEAAFTTTQSYFHYMVNYANVLYAYAKSMLDKDD